MQELKIEICPMCQEEPKLRKLTGNVSKRVYYAVACLTCGESGPVKSTPEEAIEAWNNTVKEFNEEEL